MLQKQFTKILQTPIVEHQTGQKLAEVYDLIIDPETGKLEAFWIKQNAFSGNDKILSINDVLEWKIKIYIQDEDVFIAPEEIIKIKSILEKEIPIFMHKVKTLSGTKIGRVIDIFFEPITNQIIQIQTAKFFFGFKYEKRLISYSEIYEITKEAIILKDEYRYSTLRIKEFLDLNEAI